MKFEFGMVVGMDFVPELRLMMVGPYVTHKIIGQSTSWWAVVLADTAEAGAWSPGEIVSVDPTNEGITIFDTPEGSE